MKKLNLLCSMALTLLLLNSERSFGQVSSLDGAIIDSMSSYCVLPNHANFSLYTKVTGTGTSTDSITYNVNFDDGSDTTFKRGIYFSGPGGSSSAYIYHKYTFAGTFTPRLIVKAPSGVSDTSYCGAFTLTNTCGTLNGTLYIDDNSNCIKDATENGLHWIPIVAINTAISDTFNAGWADHHGDYSLSLPPGSYIIIPNRYYSYPGLTVANPFATASCPSTGTYSLTVAASGSYTKDFAYSCSSPSSYDAQVVISGGCFFPGDSTNVYVWGGSWSWYYHYACISSGISTTVTVNIDPKLIYLGTAYGPSPTLSGSTLTYTLSSPADITRFYSGIMVKTPTTATILDTMKFSAYIAPLTGITDPNLTNNTHNYQKAVAASYDPNIKEVSPKGDGNKGYIKKNTDMTYTIHFQNTGTAAARNITITDEIDADLDINSIHILGATHNANMFRDGKIIKFRFENINLPDSGTNYKGSMGSVTYAIKQKKDLSPGTEMSNTAAIYFDYNDPIITNTTLNTIYIPTIIENVTLGNDVASVYPNPANNSLTVKMDFTKTFTIRLIDMLGRITLSQGTTEGALNINTSFIPEGLYIINISDNKGNQSSNKVQIKH